MGYVNTYQFGGEAGSATLSHFIIHPQFGKVIVGSTKQGGYYARIDKDGKPILVKEYRLADGQLLHFSKVAFFNGGVGDLCIAGFTILSDITIEIYLLKIDLNGEVLLSQKIFDRNGENFSKIVNLHILSNNHIALTAWFKDSEWTPADGNHNWVCLLKFDSQLKPPTSQISYFPNNDDRLSGSFISTENIVFYGTSVGQDNTQGIFYLTTKLNGQIEELIKYKIDDITNLKDTSFGTRNINNHKQLIILGNEDINPHGLQIYSPFLIETEENLTAKGMLVTTEGDMLLLASSDSGKSYIYKLQKQGESFKMIYRKFIDVSNAVFHDIVAHQSQIYLCGVVQESENQYKPILIETSEDFEHCKAKEEATLEFQPLEYEKGDFPIGPIHETGFGCQYANIELNTYHLDSDYKNLCVNDNYSGYYVNTYQIGTEATSVVLSNFAIHPQFGKVMVGYTLRGGYFARIDSGGRPIQAFEYCLPEGRLYFSKVAFFNGGAGEVCIAGFVIAGHRNITIFLLKVGLNGQLKQTLQIKNGKLRNLTNLHISSDNHIAITGWYLKPPSGTTDRPYLLQFDSQLEHLTSNIYYTSSTSDDQLGGSHIDDEGILLYGTTHRLFKTFHIKVDFNGNILNAFRYNLTKSMDLKDIFFGTKKENINQVYVLGNEDINPLGLSNYAPFKIDTGVDTTARAMTFTSQGYMLLLVYDAHGKHYICKMQREGESFKMLYRKSIDITNTLLYDIIEYDSDIYLFGNVREEGNKYAPILIKTTDEFDHCKSQEESLQALQDLSYTKSDLAPTVAPIECNFSSPILETKELTINHTELCGEIEPVPTPFGLQQANRIQSPALNLQAAGSTGDDSSRGIHLRWFLGGFLGNNHIPKGNEAANNNFFNRQDDFVKIYRIPYNGETKKVTVFNLNSRPFSIENNSFTWAYSVNNTRTYLRFLDQNKYNNTLSQVDPSDNPQAFLLAYGQSLIEISQSAKLAFAIHIVNTGAGSLQVETFSVANKSLAEDLPVISARKSFNQGSTARIEAENIRYIRLRCSNASLLSIEFENYSDFLNNASQREYIVPMGDFALTKSTAAAYRRLESPEKFQVHDKWKKYNDDARVNIQNYKERWSGTGDANTYPLLKGVEDYIQLSDTDPKAVKTFQEELDSNDESTFEVGLQNFLNIAALDFHVARALGMGTIDGLKNAREEEKFIYLAEYTTDKDINDFFIAKKCQHLYLSLPTSINEARLPQSVELLAVTYGLSVDNATDEPLLLTDEQGYVPYLPIRYVNIRAKIATNYEASLGFFNPPTEFESSMLTSPVFFGLEYKKESETTWKNPELAASEVYKDTNGKGETQGVLFNSDNEVPHYIHAIEKEEGVNGDEVGIIDYAAYAVNIFSRASGLSSIVKTDFTKFKTINTLKAPINVRAHLIQKENPPLFSTQREQDYLVTIGDDEILCRLDFDYSHAEDKNYHYGDKVGIYFRREAPRNVIGKITEINDDPANPSIYQLKTGKYEYISTEEVLEPIIDPSIKENFIGGMLTYRSKNYVVTSIDNSTPYPKISVKKIEQNEAIDTEGGQNSTQLQQIYETIESTPDEAFLLIENLAEPANWSKFDPEFAIDLGHTWDENEESYEVYDEQTGDVVNEYTEKAKGIWENAIVTLHNETIPPLTYPPFQKYYKIEFSNFQLDHHPDYKDITVSTNKMSAQWHGGFVRVLIDNSGQPNGKRKQLNVVAIENIGTSNNLKLIAIDNKNDDILIKTDVTIKVNFHPGYRAYLKESTSIGFDKLGILPERDEGPRISFLGLTTIDNNKQDDNGNYYSSPMGLPANLVGREIIIPERPKLPIGPLYASQPDFYNKSKYTLTTTFKENHEPWGLVYYRISISKILFLLYKKDTIKAIKAALPPVKFDENLEERWNNLLSFEPNDFEEHVIDEEGNTFKFPMPDRKDYFDHPLTDWVEITARIKDVIYSNMLPLTEQPLIWKHINTEAPTNKKQLIRDKSGKLLLPSDSAFDQAPMAQKLPVDANKHSVLFTDFSLDSNLNSDTAYFYTVRELSNSMQMGEPSPFLGPVQLVNTKAPNPLIIQKVLAPVPSIQNSYRTVVQFYVNRFSSNQDISSIEILRTTDSINALNVRNMEVVKSISIQEIDLSSGIFTIEDDFSDVNSPIEIPYSIPLYYVLRSVRLVKYADSNGDIQVQKVYSQPTKAFMTNVLDMNRPPAPTLEIHSDSDYDDNQIRNLSLTWSPVCYQGTYKVYLLNEYNNWELQATLKLYTTDNLVFEWTINTPVSRIEDEDSIFYRFKVETVNTSGMLGQAATIVV